MIGFIIGLIIGGATGFLIAACIVAETRFEEYPYGDIYYVEEDDM